MAIVCRIPRAVYRIIVSVPTQSGSLTYTGGTLTPTWSNYDSDQLTISGTTSATNAGTYTVTFTPKKGYVWWDKTTAAKNATWSIAKATPSVPVLSKTSIAFIEDGTTSFTVTRDGNGTISATSSNTSVVTASVSGTTVLVATGNSIGTATITIKVSAGTNYAAYTGTDAQCAVTTSIDTTNCLTFTSSNPFTIATNNSDSNWDGMLEWSDGTSFYRLWNGWSAISSGSSNTIYLRGRNNSYLTSGADSVIKGFAITGSGVSCSGNIETLLNYNTVKNGQHPAMAAYCFNALFYGCTALVSGPRLGATQATSYCYGSMFKNSGITSTPSMGLTVLAENCCWQMYENCTSLTSVGDLPVTTLANYCYSYMYSGCTALTAVMSTLPATILALGCYMGMFAGCTSLTTPPAIMATVSAKGGLSYMFEDCLALTKLTRIYVTGAIDEVLCASMYLGCSLIKVSQTSGGIYQYSYRIPNTGTATFSGSQSDYPTSGIISSTGGTFTGTMQLNTTYYTSTQPV